MAGRILFPQTGFTTEDLVTFYDQLAPALLPHLADRPLTLKRYPADIYGEAFWEKDAPNFTPAFVRRFAVPRKHEESLIHYIALSNEKSLRWAASIGCIEIHSFLHRYPYITSPTLIAFDLDPGHGTDLVDCCEIALKLREWLRRWKLQSFAKVSGSKGMQVYVPLNTPSSYSATQTLARRVADDLAQADPDKIISEMARAERTGKVFIDWSQNAEHKTTVSVYSLRAKHEEPFVSMPVTWKEIQQAVARNTATHLIFPPLQAIKRVQKAGDIFSPVLTLKQSIPRELGDELRLVGEPAAQAVKPREPSNRKLALPRSSGQGGRRLFVVHHRGSSFELGLEHRGKFQLYDFPKIPTRKSEQLQGHAVDMRPLGYLTDQSPKFGIVWDLGTYEIYDGSLDRGCCTVYFSGQRMNGPWRLVGNGDAWMFINDGGQVNRKLPARQSVLAMFTGSSARTRLHAR